MQQDDGRETRLSREQLYDLVWTEPMQTLGPRFGMSDVGLKKACKRLRIPTPGRGYWAQKAVGKAPHRPPLPKLPASVTAAQQTITFGRPPRPAPAEAAEATGPIADQERFEGLPENRIAVAEVLTAPHKLVAASIQLLRRAKTDQHHRLVPRGRRCLAVGVRGVREEDRPDTARLSIPGTGPRGAAGSRSPAPRLSEARRNVSSSAIPLAKGPP